MDIFLLSMWIISGILLIFSLVKDKKRTFKSAKTSGKMMKNMVSEILAILFLIGLIITLVPPETIKKVMGESNQIISTLVSAIAGAVTLIPAFVAFPLIGSLVDKGASIVPAVAFLTTLTMVGAVTFPLEKREFGKKFAINRNLFSFGFAIVIALVMGMLGGLI
jgi:uncharacterized membrane protein YraQ (UPF0718 family)